jgi:hypothetical protein
VLASVSGNFRTLFFGGDLFVKIRNVLSVVLILGAASAYANNLKFECQSREMEVVQIGLSSSQLHFVKQVSGMRQGFHIYRYVGLRSTNTSSMLKYDFSSSGNWAPRYILVSSALTQNQSGIIRVKYTDDDTGPRSYACKPLTSEKEM